MAFFLVVPGAIGSAGFHGREDMDQAGMITPLSDDGLDPVFFTKGFVAPNELNLDAGLNGKLLSVVSQLIAQRLCPSGVIEQLDLVVTEVTRHGARITDIGKGSGNDNTIEAGKYASDFILVAFDEGIHDGYPLFSLLRIRIGDTKNFGSGYAGLGSKYSCSLSMVALEESA